MRLESAFDIHGFSGINNVADPARMPPSKGIMPLREAVNVDIDDSGMISRGKGFERIQVGDFHSLWPSSDGSFALCVNSGALKKLTLVYGGLVVTLICPDLDPMARMQYVETDDRIFMTNGSFIGYFREDSLHDLADPDQTFKTRMPPGHLIEFYNNQLYVAVDRLIFYSDALAWQRTDLRKNVIPFLGRLRMIQAVKDGLWVSDDHGIYFLAGGTAKELAKIDKTDQPVFAGGFQKIDGEMMGTKEPISGEWVLMMNADGIFLGGPEGVFFNLTKNKYRPREMGEIASLVRVDPDRHQVVFVGEVAAQDLSGEMEFNLPILTMDFRG